jgi:hypothetical protein
MRVWRSRSAGCVRRRAAVRLRPAMKWAGCCWPAARDRSSRRTPKPPAACGSKPRPRSMVRRWKRWRGAWSRGPTASLEIPTAPWRCCAGSPRPIARATSGCARAQEPPTSWRVVPTAWPTSSGVLRRANRMRWRSSVGSCSTPAVPLRRPRAACCGGRTGCVGEARSAAARLQRCH